MVVCSIPPVCGALYIRIYGYRYRALIGEGIGISSQPGTATRWCAHFKVGNAFIQIIQRIWIYPIRWWSNGDSRGRGRCGSRSRFRAAPAASRQPRQREAGHRTLRGTLEGVCKSRSRHFTQHRSLSLSGRAGCRRLSGCLRVFSRSQHSPTTSSLPLDPLAMKHPELKFLHLFSALLMASCLDAPVAAKISLPLSPPATAPQLVNAGNAN